MIMNSLLLSSKKFYKTKIKNNSNKLFLLLLLIPYLIFLTPTINSQFILDDDHEIIRFSQGALTFKTALENDQKMARFRPFYWVVRTLEYSVFKNNPTSWHIFNFILILASTYLLYLALIAAGIRPVISLITTWLAFLNISAVSGWIALGPQEPLATFLLVTSLVLLFSVKSKNSRFLDFLFVISISAMAFTKETYILFIPGLLLLRLGIEYKKQKTYKIINLLKKESVLIAAVLLIFFGAVFASFYAPLKADRTAWGVIVLQTLSRHKELLLPNAIRYLKSFSLLSHSSQLLMVTVIFGVVSIFNRKKRLLQDFINNYRTFAFITIVFAITLALQTLIYSTKTYVSYHYPIPAILIFLLWLAYIFNFIYKFSFRIQKILFIITLIFIFTTSMLKWSLRYAYSYYYNSQQLSSVLKSIDDNLTDGDIIIIAGHPSYMYEQTYSIKTFIDSLATNYVYYFLPTANVLGDATTLDKYRGYISLDTGKDHFPTSTIHGRLPPLQKNSAVLVHIANSFLYELAPENTLVKKKIESSYNHLCSRKEIDFASTKLEDAITNLFKLKNFKGNFGYSITSYIITRNSSCTY